MNKLTKNKRYTLYYILVLVFLWVFAYLCFAFVIAELNPFKWEQSIRAGYVFAMISILVISFPISRLIKLEIN